MQTDRQVIALLKKDILAARQRDIQIDMSTYGVRLGPDGKYALDDNSGTANCHVCAIGAAVIGLPGKSNLGYAPALALALDLGRTLAWGRGLNFGTIDYPAGRAKELDPDLPEFDRGYAVGQKILQWVLDNDLEAEID